MLEWRIVEEDAVAVLSSAPSYPLRSRNLSLLILLLVLVVGALFWSSRWQQEVIRAEFTAVVHAEVRAIAFGQEEQASVLRDPDAAGLWAFLYDEQFRWRCSIPILPEVRRVTLGAGGEQAVVEVAWPLPSEDGEEGETVVERRAYRLVDETWRRAAPEGAGNVVRMRHVVLVGHLVDTQEFATLVPLDDLREQLEREW